MPTIVLHGCQGAGKTTIVASIARHLGCTPVLDEWDGRQPIPKGALAVTNLPLEDIRAPAGVSTVEFHQALGWL